MPTNRLKNQILKYKVSISGMIIYPENWEDISFQNHINGHNILIKTIDLNKSAVSTLDLVN